MSKKNTLKIKFILGPNCSKSYLYTGIYFLLLAPKHRMSDSNSMSRQDDQNQRECKYTYKISLRNRYGEHLKSIQILSCLVSF